MTLREQMVWRMGFFFNNIYHDDRGSRLLDIDSCVRGLDSFYQCECDIEGLITSTYISLLPLSIHAVPVTLCIKGQGFTSDFKLNLFQAMEKSGEYPCLTLIISHRDIPVEALWLFSPSPPIGDLHNAIDRLLWIISKRKYIYYASLSLFEELYELYNGC